MTLTGAVVAVGDELLLGDIVNTNAAWLGEVLAAVGVQVVTSEAVGDDVARIAAALRRALAEADVVVVTGGLGPTADDVTRAAVAEVAGAPLERIGAIEEDLRARYAAFGYPMPEQVMLQADVPRGAQWLANRMGSAPGLRVELDGRLLFAAPGPPHELRAVVGDHALPELAARSGSVLKTRTLHTSGQGESVVAEVVEAAVTVPEGVALAYLAGRGVTRVRFTGADDAVLVDLADRAAAALGEAVWGRDDDTLSGVVQSLLTAQDATVGVAESLTGGLLAAALTTHPGSSATFRGGLVPYATELKASLAGVPPDILDQHGAVSAETAGALAAGARERTGATYGLATTGVAGPSGADGQPLGTVYVAVSGPGGTQVRTRRLPGDREVVRAMAVTTALDLLRRTLSRVR
ncbi:MAG TPA: CinA family nicotinamide mononucleotide deamidase-related protein [Mycobacteriales bacterium]|nr:CinA family nicotinamide mononucleotide deamidase-related protein [Mycobacteriales bacterium]